MELDSSIGKLEVGKALADYPVLNDVIIDVELTANRGDCQSVYGLARDVAAVLEVPLKNQVCDFEDDNNKGIGRVLNLSKADDFGASMMYKVIENRGLRSSLRAAVRLGFIEAASGEKIEGMLTYATHATGVLLNAYSFGYFARNGEEKALVRLSKEGAFNRVSAGEKAVSVVGVRTESAAKASDKDELIIIEAGYVDPEAVSMAVLESDEKRDDTFYRASRGSEPDLDFGIRQLCGIARDLSEVIFYSESIQVESPAPLRTIHVGIDQVNALIGQPLEKNAMVGLLKRLQLEVQVSPEQNNLIVTPPLFRHDLKNEADIAEEIVRIVGIDNIAAKPLVMGESKGLGKAWHLYRYTRDQAQRAVSLGYYESLHFAFDHKERMVQLGLPVVEASKDLVNPITAELNTMRTSLLPPLLEAAQRNLYKARKRVALFEIGTVVDAHRHETLKMGLVATGDKEVEGTYNHGKPGPMEFDTFADHLSRLIPGMMLEQGTKPNGLIHPGQYARILCRGEAVGFLSKLHPAAAKRFDLPDTFIAEFDLEKTKPEMKTAQPTSRFQRVQRDISVVIDETIPFSRIRSAIDDLGIKSVQGFYPVDLYQDAQMGGKLSLTVRFFLQSMETTLDDTAINEAMEKVMHKLESAFGAVLR